MTRILGRPGRLLLPLVLALCAAFSDTEKAAALIMAILFSRLMSLCAGAALRKAAARVVNGARLTGNYYLALVFGALGAAVTFLMAAFLEAGIPGIAVSTETALAGGLITMAQIASEGLYSIPDGISGVACDGLIALYAAAGLLISCGNHVLLIAACGLCLVAAVALSIALRKTPGFAPGTQVIKSMPMAILKTGMPSMAAGLLLTVNPVATAIFWGIFEAMETPIRRSPQEGHWLNMVCAITAAAGAAGAMAIHHSIALCAMAAVFFLMIFSAPINRRSVSLLACLMAALLCGFEYAARAADILPGIALMTGAAVLSVTGIIITIPDMKNAYIRLRAAKRRRAR